MRHPGCAKRRPGSSVFLLKANGCVIPVARSAERDPVSFCSKPLDSRLRGNDAGRYAGFGPTSAVAPMRRASSSACFGERSNSPITRSARRLVSGTVSSGFSQPCFR